MKKYIIPLVLALATSPGLVQAGVKDDIIARCREQMGEYGAAMVKACADQDIEALRALNNYPNEYGSIIARCYRQMKEYGYAMVKACADQDIEAEKALQNY